MKKKEHKVGEVASLTKMMTMIVALEIVKERELDIDEDIYIVSKQSSQVGGTTARVKNGDRFTLR